MSNLNTRKTPRKSKVTTNHGGEKSYAYNAKEALAAMATTSLVADTYYQSSAETLNEMRDVVNRLANSDPEFVLKTAAFARSEMNMRSFPQVLLAEASANPKLKPYVRKWADFIMSRADEPADVLAYYLDKYGKPLPNSLKRAIAARLQKFTPYQLAKYQRSKSNVTMADVIKLTHPKLGEIGRQILEGTAKADTWEAALSKSGGENKTEVWETMIPKMGYMALLRNLRNFVKEEISHEMVNFVCDKLTNPKEVANSKQFPFRFFAAYREMEKLIGKEYTAYGRFTSSIGEASTTRQKNTVNKFMTALERAMDESVKNINIEGNTLFLVDSSGSMSYMLNDKSSMSYVDISLILGIAGVRAAEASDLWTFDSTHVKRRVRSSSSLLDQMLSIRKTCNGGATILNSPLNDIVRNKIKYDNIVVLSDMQVYSAGYSSYGPESVWKAYSKIFPDAHMYLINLASYNRGTVVKRSGNVTFITGWTEKVLAMIGQGNGNSIVSEIEEWNPFVS